LPSSTLKLMKDKVLVLLDADTDYHIEKWKTLKSNIEKVCEYKGITLRNKEY
jgi:hypothetical protein